jgi:hypothetical protein
VGRTFLSAILQEPVRFSCVVFLFPLRDAPFPLSSHDSTCARRPVCHKNTFRGLTRFVIFGFARQNPVGQTFLSAIHSTNSGLARILETASPPALLPPPPSLVKQVTARFRIPVTFITSVRPITYVKIARSPAHLPKPYYYSLFISSSINPFNKER